MPRGRGGFEQGFTCPVLLGIPLGSLGISPTGLSPSMAGHSMPCRLFLKIPHRGPATPPGKPGGLGFSAFARRYLRNHICFLFLRVLRCFTSPGVAPPPYEFRRQRSGIAGTGFPIRRSPDQSVFAAPRSLSQLATSFIAPWCQGIRRAPFLA